MGNEKKSFLKKSMHFPSTFSERSGGVEMVRNEAAIRQMLQIMFSVRNSDSVVQPLYKENYAENSFDPWGNNLIQYIEARSRNSSHDNKPAGMVAEKSRLAGWKKYSRIKSFTNDGIIDPQDDIAALAAKKPFIPSLRINQATRLAETASEWQHLLRPLAKDQTKAVEIWLKYKDKGEANYSSLQKLESGRDALFYGPPATGKAISQFKTEKYTSIEIYRIDLSMVVSSYIGETEKNLKQLFEKAENKDWLLSFDEADALFGKRTELRDAQDKYANQEVSYLLHRVERYDGLVIYRAPK